MEDKQEAAENAQAKTRFSSRLKRNPWIASTGILITICLILIAFIFGFGSSTGNVVSENEAGTKIVSFLNSKVGGGVSQSSIEDIGSVYKVMVSYQGGDIPVYVTKDGKYFVQGLTPLTGEAISQQEQETLKETPKEIPKSDKPKVEAFVFSYCPYGTQFEKALIPVYKILKNKADINIVAIGAMHGEYEKQESLRQLCIQKIYGKDKLFNYLEKFLGETAIGNCNGDEKCLEPLINKLYSQTGISKSVVDSCMQKDAAALYSSDTARASQLGISGSPGFVINGVEVSVNRSPDAIMKAICSAFNTEPEECSQAVSSEAAQPGFGYGESPSVSNTHASGSC